MPHSTGVSPVLSSPPQDPSAEGWCRASGTSAEKQELKKKGLCLLWRSTRFSGASPTPWDRPGGWDWLCVGMKSGQKHEGEYKSPSTSLFPLPWCKGGRWAPRMTEDPTDMGRGRKDRKGKQGRQQAAIRPASCQDHTPPAPCRVRHSLIRPRQAPGRRAGADGPRPHYGGWPVTCHRAQRARPSRPLPQCRRGERPCTAETGRAERRREGRLRRAGGTLAGAAPAPRGGGSSR